MYYISISLVSFQSSIISFHFTKVQRRDNTSTPLIEISTPLTTPYGDPPETAASLTVHSPHLSCRLANCFHTPGIHFIFTISPTHTFIPLETQWPSCHRRTHARTRTRTHTHTHTHTDTHTHTHTQTHTHTHTHTRSARAQTQTHTHTHAHTHPDIHTFCTLQVIVPVIHFF